MIAQLTRLGNITGSSLKNSLSHFLKKVNDFRHFFENVFIIFNARMRGKIKEIGDADVSSLSLERRDSHRTTDFNSSISQKSDLSTPKPKISLKENDGVDDKHPISYTKEEARAMVDKIMEVFVGEDKSYSEVVIKIESPAPPTTIGGIPAAEGGLELSNRSIHQKERIVKQ